MKVLVIGSGGREHALVWKILQSARDPLVACTPSNAGIDAERVGDGRAVVSLGIAAMDIDGLVKAAISGCYDRTIVSSDDPLAAGIVDRFRAEGLPIWGPTKSAAQFEWSKIWAFEFMERHGIPVPEGRGCNNRHDAERFAASLGFTCAIKVDGLALGKGVLICKDAAEVASALKRIFDDKEFGAAGERVLIQKLVVGKEISLHFFCDGKTAKAFPSSKDHKKEFEGEKGRNTGGMGAISDSPDIDETTLQKIVAQVIEPWLKGCAAEGIDFRGILYPGLMILEDGTIVVLEFNARFGDPETQVYLPRLENDFLDIVDATESQTLSQLPIYWSDLISTCVVMASAGYPGSYPKGKLITGLDEVSTWCNVQVFHSGTKRESECGPFLTNGGRVLGVTAWHKDRSVSRALAYAAVRRIRFEGAHFRKDIGGPPIQF